MKKLNTNAQTGFLILVFVIFSIESSDCTLTDVYSWNVLDLKFPSEEMKQDLIAKGKFDPKEFYVDTFEVGKDKLFLSLVSSKVPIRVAYIKSNNASKTQSPQLIPYPDWNTNKKFDGTRVTLRVDACDRLWICNQEIYKRSGFGFFQTTESSLRIFIYDLKTDRLIREREIQIKATEPITSFVVDVTKDTCNKAFAYITAPPTFMSCATPIIYDFENNKVSDINPYFSTSCYEFHFGPENCESGPLQMSYVTLLSAQADGYRTIYFESDPSPTTVNKAFTISSKVMQSKTEGDSRDEHKFLGCYPAIKQHAVFDEKTGFLFHITSHQDRVIRCWDSINHAGDLSYATSGEYTVNGTGWALRSMKVDRNGNLWLLFGRFEDKGEKWSPKPIDENIANLKISMIPAAEVVADADYSLSYAVIIIIILAVVLFIYCITYFIKKRAKRSGNSQATGLHQNH